LPLLGVGAASLKAFADMEKLENGLIAIMGTSEGAKEELDKLRKVAENPGLALPQVVQASASLQSVGMSADAARETITQFGNAVARSGGGAEQFSGVTLALSQISAVGKVTQEDLNQIKERLPEFARVMKEEFGTVTAEGIRAIGVSSEEFIIISTYGALAGASKLIVQAIGNISKAFSYLAANPMILVVTASIAAIGAIALYVYDNWKAFSDNFKNIWINIKNSVMEGVANVLKNIDYLQKALGLNLFNLDGLTSYQKEQRIVATEFKSIGDTVDSLKGKLASLFTTGAKATGGGGGITAPTMPTEPSATTPTGGGGSGPGSAASMGAGLGVIGILPTLDLLPDKLESISAANERLKQTNEDVANSFTKITPVAKSAYDSLGQGQQIIAASILSFGELAASGFESMKELAAAVRKSIADIIANFIRMYVAKALASLPLSPFMVAIAPAIAAAAGGVAKSLIMKIGAPKLAEGALAFGPTMATVGDNRNARVDPEVIAPLSKLKSMMGDVGMGGVLETRISGNDLIILLNRSQKGLSRIQ